MLKQKSKEIIAIIDAAIENFLNNDFDVRNTILQDAVKYALRSGGKRFRPTLMIIVGQSYGITTRELEPYFIALELIHTYSLIHDDLPCMDNDDFRRGKPTLHKVFGEANAVLTGDLLLNLAHTLLITKAECNHAATIISKAGQNMIVGQVDDINGIEITKDRILEMYHNKTGALIAASVMVPFIIRKDESKTSEMENLVKLSQSIGAIFQLADDISDYKAGKDKDKITIPNAIGLNETESLLQSLLKETKDLISSLNNLEDLSVYLDETIESFLKTTN